MEIVHSIKDLQAGLAALRAQGKTVGLVPTMGALHAGHASLVKRSVAENDATVVSIFVNPTQFNDKNDLAKYPRTLEADCRLLEQCGATFAFAPSVFSFLRLMLFHLLCPDMGKSLLYILKSPPAGRRAVVARLWQHTKSNSIIVAQPGRAFKSYRPGFRRIVGKNALFLPVYSRRRALG